jgi:hypothetical protein
MTRTDSALALVTAMVALACQERVHVGDVRGTLELDRCFGVDTRCEPSDVPQLEVEPVFNELEPARCEDDSSWYVAWWRSIEQQRCPPLGFCTAEEVSVGRDGSLWTAGMGSEPAQEEVEETNLGIFVSRYSADGDLIARRVIETRSYGWNFYDHSFAIATGSRGHAFIAVRWPGETARIVELDERAEPVGRPVELTGLPAESTVGLVVDAAGDIYLNANTNAQFESASAGASILAKLDSKLEPVWIQNRALAETYYQVFATSLGDIALFGVRRSHPHDVEVAASFDEHGNRRSEFLLRDGFTAGIGLDRHGSLLRAVDPTGDGSFAATKVSAEGGSIFRVMIGDASKDPTIGTLHSVAMTLDAEGRSYYARHRRDAIEGKDGIDLVQLEANGEECTRSWIVDAVPGPNQNFFEVGELRKLWRADDGTFYFHATGSVGRIAR